MKDLEQKSLEQLLDQLSSDLARSRVIEKLIENDSSLSTEIINRGLKGYEEKGMLIDAGYLAHLVGRRKAAKQYFETAISQEGDVSRLRTIIDLAKIRDIPWVVERAADEAISLLKKQFPDPEALESAADIGRESNWYDSEMVRDCYLQAMRIREERGEYVLAARDARSAGLTVKAIDFYIQAKDLPEAGKLAQEIGLYERAVDLFVQAKDYAKALSAAEEGGLKNQIADVVSKVIQEFEEEWGIFGYSKVHELALRYGLEDKANVIVKLGRILGVSYAQPGIVQIGFFHP